MDGLVWERDPAVWRETMRVNLDGPFELTRLTVGGMCERGFGRVVFTSSTAGEKAERSGSAYTASKHGVIGLARAVAQEAGPFGVTFQRGIARLGADANGRALGADGGPTARYQRVTGVARARRHLPAEASAGAT
jgi:NAD(P)-dependent dehydrogenase (short-subunit alcohol dehydrogenase family)